MLSTLRLGENLLSSRLERILHPEDRQEVRKSVEIRIVS